MYLRHHGIDCAVNELLFFLLNEVRLMKAHLFLLILVVFFVVGLLFSLLFLSHGAILPHGVVLELMS
jgi:hypothetical protein